MGLNNPFNPPAVLSPDSNIMWNSRMEVNQDSGVYTGGVDGWRKYQAGTMVVTAAQSASGIAGFAQSMKFTVTTAEAVLGVNDHFSPYMGIEGRRMSTLGFGASGAKPITIAFMCRSNVTGTFSIGLQNAANTRAYATLISITANTDSFVVVQVPGDVTGSWPTDTNASFYLSIVLAGGSNRFIPSANSWQASGNYTVSGQSNFVATNGNTFEMTGLVMLPNALAINQSMLGALTRPYDEELKIAQCYYENSWNSVPASWTQGNGTGITLSHTIAQCRFSVPFKTPKRIAPTITIYDTSLNSAKVSYFNGAAWTTGGAITSGGLASVNQFYFTHTITSGTSTELGFKADSTIA